MLSVLRGFETSIKLKALDKFIIRYVIVFKTCILKTVKMHKLILCVSAFIVLSCPPSQIRSVPLWRVSSRQLSAVLRSRRSVDAERTAGGHAGHRGNGPSKARANRFLPAAGGQRPAGSQRGAGPVDGHGAVAARRDSWKEPRAHRDAVVSGDVWTIKL